MRTIIAGSRSIDKICDISDAVYFSKFNPTVVLSGCAKGADYLGERWAEARNIPIEKFPADWHPGDYYDPGAGYERNVRMAKNAEALIAVWDGHSKGTKHMINIAYAFGLKVFVYPVE